MPHDKITGYIVGILITIIGLTGLLFRASHPWLPQGDELDYLVVLSIAVIMIGLIFILPDFHQK